MEMKVYKGIAASSGIGIGDSFIYNQRFLIPHFSISGYQVEYEVDRFYTTLRRTKKEYEELQRKMIQEMSEDDAKFLDSHILMTEDQTLIDCVVEKLRDEKKNLEWVIYEVVDDLYKKFTQLKDEYFRDRAIDILDLGRKLIRILLSQKQASLSDLTENVVIVASDLSVSDTASMNKRYVLGFVTELGGKTSHTAILARSLGIPAVLGVENFTHISTTGDVIIVDGINGKVILNPDDATLKTYKHIKREYEKRKHDYIVLKDVPSITMDHKAIALMANMEIPEQEIDIVLNFGADGIGLYRSEFLYLSKRRRVLPTEEQQLNAYKFILEKFQQKPVTIRTLDLGGDKLLDGVTMKEMNPYLGWRAIRFCLANPDIFKTQLRALLRASMYGNLSIMLPMIANVEEVVQTRVIIEEVKEELTSKGIEFKENIPLGVMIETPAAALVSDKLAQMVDFFSIGTNDLIQYILACDRGNERIAYLYEPLNPAVLKMIKLTIDNAHKNNIKVSICGEMGSEYRNALILIGMGIDELSLTPIKILELKKVIQNVNYSAVKKLADEALELHSHNDVIELVDRWVEKNLDFEI